MDIFKLNSDIQDKIGGNTVTLCSISNGENASGVSKLMNLNDKISNYKWIVIYLGDGFVTFDSFLMHSDAVRTFVSETNMIAFGIDTMRQGYRTYALFTYKSDTQLFAQIPAGYACTLAGIK